MIACIRENFWYSQDALLSCISSKFERLQARTDINCGEYSGSLGKRSSVQEIPNSHWLERWVCSTYFDHIVQIDISHGAPAEQRCRHNYLVNLRGDVECNARHAIGKKKTRIPWRANSDHRSSTSIAKRNALFSYSSGSKEAIEWRIGSKNSRVPGIVERKLGSNTSQKKADSQHHHHVPLPSGLRLGKDCNNTAGRMISGQTRGDRWSSLWSTTWPWETVVVDFKKIILDKTRRIWLPSRLVFLISGVFRVWSDATHWKRRRVYTEYTSWSVPQPTFFREHTLRTPWLKIKVCPRHS